ncbi:MAG: glycosyltransferase [Flavobacteriales bacterium]|nr:glycosyltransferase [Flavobacteriales bacterium]MBK7942099.1 glycosyltransferase [Flavobacteriales bacterium]MBK9700641.1 glycosyltransferase [Flavobacteriales bacterium]
MPSTPKRAIVSVTNDLATDNRVHRTCTVLQDLGYAVLLVGRMLPGSPAIERPYATTRMRLVFRKGPFFYAEYNLRLFLLLLRRRATVLVSNDLDTLPANFLAARITGTTLVYDSHELFTEVPELVGRPRVQRVWRTLERWIFPRLKHVVTVNESIANVYRQRYGVPVHVVRNIPVPRPLAPAPGRPALGLPDDRFVLVLQGAGINVDRGGEEAVLAMRHLPQALLLVIGSGDAWPVLERLVQEHGLQDRVRLMGRMPYERLMDFTRAADLGLSLDKDSNLNYRYSLPNKLFDYLHAGLPVLATDLPEVAAVVRAHDCGVLLPMPTPQAIAGAVEALRTDPDRLAALRTNATFAARTFDGARERDLLRRLFSDLG